MVSTRPSSSRAKVSRMMAMSSLRVYLAAPSSSLKWVRVMVCYGRATSRSVPAATRALLRNARDLPPLPSGRIREGRCRRNASVSAGASAAAQLRRGDGQVAGLVHVKPHLRVGHLDDGAVDAQLLPHDAL